MQLYWAALLILPYLTDGELRISHGAFTCDRAERTKLFNDLYTIHFLILRDVKLASILTKGRNPIRVNGITSCKSMLRTLANLGQGNVNTMLDTILRYNKFDVLSLPVPQIEHFWQKITAREYGNAQTFVDTTERVYAIARSKELLKGKTLLAAARDQKPSIYFKQTNDSKRVTEVGGDMIEILDIIKDSLGFNYTVIPAFDASVIVNGSWTGTIGMLARKEADINLQPFNFEADKHAVVDYCIALHGGSFTIMLPYPKEIRSLLASTWPFEPTVWLCVLVTMIAITFTLSTAAILRTKRKSLLNVISEAFMYTYGLITCQGLECPGRTHKNRLVAGMWGMAGLVLVYSYNSQLTSYLTVPQLKPIVNSMEELAHNNYLEVTVMPGSNIGLDLLAATSGTYKILGDRIRQNPKKNLAQSFDDAVNKVATGRYAFPTNDYTATHYGNILFGKTRTCSVMLMNQPLRYIHSTFTLQKQSVYLPAINDKLHDFMKSGLVIQIRKYSSRGLPRFRDRCKVPVKDFPTNVVLTLSQLQSAFAILGIGLLAAFITLLCELTISKSYSRYR